MNDLVISEITEEKIPLLSRLADEIWHEHYTGILSEEQIDYMVDKYQSEKAVVEQLEQEGYRYYLLYAGEDPVGFTGIVPGEDSLFLSKLYILKSFRGRGYASRVFVFLEEAARSRGLKSIWLTVNRHNEESIAVYKAKGYSVVREQAADIGNGYVMDDFIMEKRLQ